jgi:hypothetical protein
MKKRLLALVLVCGCLCVNPIVSYAETNDLETTTEETEKLHFELDTGIIEFDSYEYVSKGFYVSDGDVSKTIVLNFSYTNKENTPKSYTSDFYITAFQNGTEINFSGTYSTEWAPESFLNAHNEVLKDGTLTIGCAFVLQDYSPITIIVRHNGGSEMSEPMVLEIEEYSDDSFDLNRLYGLWEDENSDKSLELSSAEIRLGTSKGSSHTSNPKLWTEGNILYTNYSKCTDLTIEEESGSPLRMYNDEFSFVQVESWPETDTEDGSAEATVLAERTYECYEECPAIPNASDALDIKQSNKSVKRTNGVLEEIVYKYSVGSDVMNEYVKFLEEYGFNVEQVSDKEFVISANNVKVATVMHDGSEMLVYIETNVIDITSIEPQAEDDESSDTVYTDADTITRVQEALNNAGFNCGTPDGIAGSGTYSALNAYQEANGLVVENVITDTLLSALGLK